MAQSNSLHADYYIPANSPEELKPGFLLTFEEDTESTALSELADRAGIQHVAHSRDYSGQAPNLADDSDRDILVFDEVGVALVTVDSDRTRRGMDVSIASNSMTNAEPEPIFFALNNFDLSPNSLAYMQGFSDGVSSLRQAMTDSSTTGSGVKSITSFSNSAALTWGLQATGVDFSTLSGMGVKVAILDTGMDLNHPDFVGRTIVSESFIPGETVDDRNGHGTHCIGTACGSRNPSLGPRYGVAYEAEIYVGKVLSNQGSSLGRSTLSGINWALEQSCDIISMSLGGKVFPGQGFSPSFERAGRAAMLQNCLIIAAAGNESNRARNLIQPVGSPANCPSIMAVAAVDSNLDIANFSNGGINTDGRVDIAGPGVSIYSSAPDSPSATPQPPFFIRWPNRYHSISGTSMATPHVSGIAALYRQVYPSITADQLWRLLTSNSTPIPLFSSRDVGAGMVKSL